MAAVLTDEDGGGKNVSRRLISLGLIGFGVLVTIFVVVMTAGGGTQRALQQKNQQQEAERINRVLNQDVPDPKEARRILDAQTPREPPAAQAPQRPAPRQPAFVPPPTDRLPPDLDPITAGRLAELDLGDIDRRAREREGRRGAPPSRSAANAMSMPEVFDAGKPKPVVDQAVERASDGRVTRDPEAQKQQGRSQAAVQQGDDAPLDAYEARRPQKSPTQYLLAEGSILDVVLINSVNTQTPGSVQLRVVSDVYDSLGERKLLIPRGTRLVASYSSQANRVGLDRVPLVVRRILFQDGRSIALDGSQITDAMGNVGAGAEHHSNLLKAIGPSALVALLGYWADQELGPTSVASGSSTPTASQSVTQQILPKIEERIASRYGAAQPYYTIDAGARLNLMLTQDLSIPPYSATEASK